MQLFKSKIFIVFTIFIILSGLLFAQQKNNNKTDLEKRRAALMSEIAAAQKILQETRNEKSTSLAHLKALKAKMEARQSLINNLNTEMQGLDNSIASTSQEINVLNKNIDVLTVNYARSVRYAYKHQNAQNMIAFLLSAENFNEAMKRYQFMKKSRDFRHHQADKLKLNQQKLAVNVNTLKNNKAKKVQHKNDQESQKIIIAEESNETSLVLNELLSKEKDIASEINKKRNDARQLDNTIKSIIKAEVEIARKAGIEEARKKAVEEQRIKNEEIARKAAADKAARDAAIAKKASEDKARMEKAARDEEARRKSDIALREKQESERIAKLNAENKKSRNDNADLRSVKPTKTESVKSNNPRYVAVENDRKVIEKPIENKPSPRVLASKPSEPSKPVTTVTQPAAPIKVETPDYKNALTPEVRNLSNNFAANKGSLPWPVTNGFVSTPFGNYTHPLEHKVTLQNLGIDITSSAGSAVRTVFAGTVSRVVKVAGSYTIVINHGEFFTVYSYLSSVSVKQGQVLSGKQSIGVVGLNDDGENVVHFEICRVGSNNSISNENPSAWISR